MNLLDQNGNLDSKLQAIVDIGSTRVNVALIKGKTLITSGSVSSPDNEFEMGGFWKKKRNAVGTTIQNPLISKSKQPGNLSIARRNTRL